MLGMREGKKKREVNREEPEIQRKPQGKGNNRMEQTEEETME